MAIPLRRPRVDAPHVTRVTDYAAQQALRELWTQLQHVIDTTGDLQRSHASLVAQVTDISTLQDQLTQTVDQHASAISSVRSAQAAANAGGPGDNTGGPGDTVDDGGEAGSGFSQAGSNGHVDAGSALTLATFGKIVGGTATEFPALTVATVDQPTREANALQLLERIIWHLNQAGFVAGRQQNPSGVISQDKLTVQVSGTWWAYDVFRGSSFTLPLEVQVIPVAPAHYVADGGTAD